MFRIAAATAVLVVTHAAGACAGDPIQLGWVEKARIYPGGLVMKAKLDTGALTTSIHTEGYEVFSKNGERWVRFTIKGATASRQFERKVVRMVRIRRAGTEVQQRPVVQLGICIGGYYKMANVNLTQRHRMLYKLLIGRRYLANAVLVNSSRTFVGKPDCRDAPK